MLLLIRPIVLPIAAFAISPWLIEMDINLTNYFLSSGRSGSVAFFVVHNQEGQYNNIVIDNKKKI